MMITTQIHAMQWSKFQASEWRVFARIGNIFKPTVQMHSDPVLIPLQEKSAQFPQMIFKNKLQPESQKA